MTPSMEMRAIWLMTITLANALPLQEFPGSIDEILHQAWNHAGGGQELPSLPGFGEGAHPFETVENSEGPGEDQLNQGLDTGGAFSPIDGTDGGMVESILTPQSSPMEESAALVSPSLSETEVPSELFVNPEEIGTASQPSVDGIPNFPMFAGSGTNQPQSLIQGLWGMLNNAQSGNATAGGSGIGTVQNGSAIGQGTGVADVGFGGFGIGLGIGAAIQTPLGNLAFGQGSGVAVGK